MCFICAHINRNLITVTSSYRKPFRSIDTSFVFFIYMIDRNLLGNTDSKSSYKNQVNTLNRLRQSNNLECFANLQINRNLINALITSTSTYKNRRHIHQTNLDQWRHRCVYSFAYRSKSKRTCPLHIKLQDSRNHTSKTAGRMETLA